MVSYLIYKRFPLWIAHLLVWLGYATFIYIAHIISKPTTTFIEVFILLLPFCITFYINLYILELYKSTWLLRAIAFFAVFLIMSGFGYYYLRLMLPLKDTHIYTSGNFRTDLKNAMLGYVQYSAYAMLYFYIRKTWKIEKNIRRLQEEKLILEKEKINRELENAILKSQELKSQQDKLQYEYAFLRAQINPHFLHNTLNVLFSQALMFSQDLADNIMKLSRIMRYSLESVEIEGGKISIHKELEHLETLLEIHNLRFGNTKFIRYNIEGAIQNQMLPPLSIITIVENAFKYGDLKDSQQPLDIKIRLMPKEIYFYCRNKKKENNIHPTSLNIGITNLSKRLDVAFKDMYHMTAVNEETFYTFELIIKN